MESKTIIENDKLELVKALQKAAEENNPEAAAEAYKAFFGKIEESIIKEAQSIAKETADKTLEEVALAKRGVAILTPEEEKFFKHFIDVAKTPTGTNFTDTIPTTFIERVFEDLKKDHELLNHIQFENTGAMTKFIYHAAASGAAAWGELNSAITEEIVGDFKSITLNLAKLTAFMVVSNDMLDLGPRWIEKYMRVSLVECVSDGVEAGAVAGKGIGGEPIGMKKNLAGSVNQTTGYPDKTAIEITDFSPETYGSLLAMMSQTPDGESRKIKKVFIAANPKTYLTKILPAITLLSTSGEYVKAVPYPTDFVQVDSGLEDDEAIIGIEKAYIMALGNGKNGKIEESKEAMFLEDCKTYKIKLYGAGQAKDNNCCLLLDVSGLEPLALRVHNDVAEIPAAEGEGEGEGEGE